MNLLLDNDVPDDLSYLLERMGHDVVLLRSVLQGDSSDEAVIDFAYDFGYVLLTCNRRHLLELAKKRPHRGIVIVIRRRNRAEERAALFRLWQRVGEGGLRDNVNFA